MTLFHHVILYGASLCAAMLLRLMAGEAGEFLS